MLKFSKTDQPLKEISIEAKNTGKASIGGQMAQSTKVNGQIIKSKVLGFTNGQMVVAMKVAGNETNSTGKVIIPGRMDEATQVNTSRTKSKDLVSIFGRMARSTRENGSTESSTGEGNSLIIREKVGQESGKTVSANAGLPAQPKTLTIKLWIK